MSVISPIVPINTRIIDNNIPVNIVANVKIMNGELEKENIDWLQFGIEKKDDCLPEDWKVLTDSIICYSEYAINEMFDHIKDRIDYFKEEHANNPKYYAKIELEHDENIPYVKCYDTWVNDNLISLEEHVDMGGGGAIRKRIEISDFEIEDAS